MSNTNTNKQTVRSRPDQSGFSGNTKTLFLLAAISTCFMATVFSQVPEIEWQNTIGGTGNEYLYSLDETSDGGYILGGTSYSGISGDKTEANLGSGDYWIIKVNSSGSIEWQNTIGGSDNDFMWSIQQTADGGYILGGYSESGISGDKTEALIGEYDYWVIKLNSTGAIEWQNTIGGSHWDYLTAFEQTSDGGYIVGGSSYSGISGDKTEASLGDFDYWVLKLNSTGTIEWQNTIGGSNDEELTCLQQTAEGGYILGGHSFSDISGDKSEESLGQDYWVVKLNSSGAIEWQNTIGGDNYDWLQSIQQTSDGGYILGGSSYSEISGDKTEANVGECSKGYCEADYWVVKLNSAGGIEWQNDIGGKADDWFYAIQQTSDGGYILGGVSESSISGDKTETSLGANDYWIIKLNGTGAIEWQNTIGGNLTDELRAIQQTSDGGYILGGYSHSDISGDKTEANMGSSFTRDYWIVKLAGPVLSCDIPTGEFTSKITATTVKTNWNAVNAANKYKVRYKPTGTNTWTNLSVNVNYKKLTNLSPSTQYDWQVKSICTLAGLGKSDWSPTQIVTTAPLKISDELAQQSVFKVYPNPFSSSTTITFSIEEPSNIIIELFDMAGRKLETLLDESIEAGSHEVNLDRRQLPAGMYVLRMKTLSSTVTQSIIIQ